MYDRKKFSLLDGTQRNNLMNIILYESISASFYSIIKSRKREFFLLFLLFWTSQGGILDFSQHLTAVSHSGSSGGVVQEAGRLPG
jgi:hypothetical protein